MVLPQSENKMKHEFSPVSVTKYLKYFQYIFPELSSAFNIKMVYKNRVTCEYIPSCDCVSICFCVCLCMNVCVNLYASYV